MLIFRVNAWVEEKRVSGRIRSHDLLITRQTPGRLWYAMVAITPQKRRPGVRVTYLRQRVKFILPYYITLHHGMVFLVCCLVEGKKDSSKKACKKPVRRKKEPNRNHQDNLMDSTPLKNRRTFRVSSHRQGGGVTSIMERFFVAS